MAQPGLVNNLRALKSLVFLKWSWEEMGMLRVLSSEEGRCATKSLWKQRAGFATAECLRHGVLWKVHCRQKKFMDSVQTSNKI